MNYYQVLNIEPNAKAAEVKAAYRSLGEKYHPDSSKEPSAQQKFRLITEAYTVLSDLQSRMTYDLTKSSKDEIQSILAKKRDKDGLDVEVPKYSPHQFGYKRLKDLAEQRKKFNLDKFYRYRGGLPEKDMGAVRRGGYGIPGERAEVQALNYIAQDGESTAFFSTTVDSTEASMFKLSNGMDASSYTIHRPFMPAEIDYTLLKFPIVTRYVIFTVVVASLYFGFQLLPEGPRFLNRQKLQEFKEKAAHVKVPAAGMRAISLS